MPKKTYRNIILSSDGTGNSGGYRYDSNVWRLHTALEKQRYKENPTRQQQIAYYHDGVGTDDNKIMKMITGAVGIGLNRIIVELYIFLVNNYEPGDRIYLFGFSRGSYTVRLLAGMITAFGVLKKQNYAEKSDQDLREDAKKLLKTYKRWQRTKNTDQPLEKPQNDVGSTHTNSDQIEFIGVWDTVDAYGIPSDLVARIVDKLLNTSFRYHDRTLSDNVVKARHALALDDQRRIFSPVLWDEKGPQDHERIHQVWFSGTHSNVGGGYPKQGMAWTSLEWMMQEAQEAGLVFDPGDIRQFSENKDAHDRLYDSRAGAAAYYAYKIRDVWNLVNAVSTIQNDKMGPRKILPRIHTSVFDRIMRRTQEYSPINIPEEFELAGEQKEEEAVLAFAQLYKNLPSQKNSDIKKPEKDALNFISKYSAYFMFWSQFIFLAVFARNLYYCGFTWSSTIQTISGFIAIWLLVWGLVHFVKQREKRRYSTFWRTLINKLPANTPPET